MTDEEEVLIRGWLMDYATLNETQRGYILTYPQLVSNLWKLVTHTKGFEESRRTEINEQDDKREALIWGESVSTDTTVVSEAEIPIIWKHMYEALVRRLVEIADEPSATERMIDYDRVARAHESVLDD